MEIPTQAPPGSLSMEPKEVSGDVRLADFFDICR